MAVDASKVRVAVTGAVMKGATTAAAPTGTSGTTTGFVDLGGISTDGVEIELPSAGDSEVIRVWQNNMIVRTIRTPDDESPTWKFTMMETKKETVETYFGVTITQTATEGSFEWKNDARTPSSYIVDAIDGLELIRDYIPNGVVTEVESHTFQSQDATGYTVTVAGDFAATKNYNFKRWSTALKS